MSASGIPFLSLLVALPAVGGVLAAASRDDRRARAVGAAFAIATSVATIALGLVFLRAPEIVLAELGPTIPGLGARWHLGVDGVAVLLLPLAALLTSAVVIAAPHVDMERGSVAAVLYTLSATLGVYCALDLVLLSAFWIAMLVPGAAQMHRARSADVRQRLARTYDVFLVLGSLPIIATALLVGWARTSAGAAHPFDLSSEGGAALGESHQQWVFVLLALATLIRTAIVPFHSWLPVLIEGGPVGISSLVLGTHVGATLIVRLAIPLAPRASAADLPTLTGVALFGAAYTAFVAIGQRDLRRTLGFVLTSQLALVIVGLAAADTESMHSAMLQMIAMSLTTSGLLLVAAAIQARAGTTEIARLGGLATRFPRMTGAFFMLAIAATGFPGSLQFVAEDLLLHGLLDTHPLVAVVLLVTTVANGITLLRVFFAMFLGAAREKERIGPGIVDLLPRETAVLLALVVLVLAAGAGPQALIAIRAHGVQSMAIADTARAASEP